MSKYETIIYWSAEDACFVAEVPELAGCIAHGLTQAKALSAANAAVKAWLSVAREVGREIPEPRGERLMYA
jgi:predicted RNase H-like HicB family nuclease